MKNELYVKGLAIAIAAAFLLMVGNGLVASKTEIGEVGLEMIDASAITMERPTLDIARLRETHMDALNSPPVMKPDSIAFDESFEDDVLGDVPDDPPWAVTEQLTGEFSAWGPDDFEDDVVGADPDAPWKTVDGAAIPTTWGVQTFESYTPAGTSIPPEAFEGDLGTLYNVAGSLVSSTNVGNPASRMGGALSGGGLSADLTGGGATSFFGPAFSNFPTDSSIYLGGWFQQKQLTADRVLQILAYDFDAGDAPCVVAMYPYGTPIAGRYVAWDSVGGNLLTPTWTANTWVEIFMQIDITAQQYTVWINNANAGTFNFVFSTTNIDGFVIYAAANTGIRCDNLMIGNPPTGGTHAVTVSNAWSSSLDGGSKSVFIDQNNYASQQASASVRFPAPYGWGEYAGVNFAVRTSTTIANTNGATFRILDYNQRTLMALRFSGGQIQYQTGATWVNAMAFAANTEYVIAIYMNGFEKAYSGLYIDDTEFDLFGLPLVNPGAGVGGFVAEGTVSTQSEIYFDMLEMFGDLQDGTVRISDLKARTGSQSARMFEGNAADYTDMGAYLGGDGCAYGEFWFHFYGDGTLGGGVVYILDTTQSYLVTIISLGGDLSAANIPKPGTVSWVDGNGAGGGTIIPGLAITPNTWNNISIRYNANLKSFEARWNGALQGTFGFLENGAADAGIIFIFGEGPAAPCDWFFDDIGLWVDDLPEPATNLRTYFPDPMPSNEAWYTVNQDNAVQGTVTGTYTNLAAVDGTTQNIQEAFVAGSSTPYTQTRFMRGDQHTINGLAAHQLSTTQSATAQNSQVTNGATLYTGMRAWVRNSGGTETEITGGSAVAIVERAANAEGLQTATWDCPATPISPTDSIVIRVYQAFATPPTTLAGEFTTEQLGGTTLTAATWTMNYYTYRAGNNNAQRVGRFYWGTATYNSRITNFQWATIIPDSYSLEHRWRTENVPAGATTMKLYVTGRTSAGADDTFAFGYSTVLGGPYTPILTVGSDTMTTYNAAIPIMSGQFYINVIDANSADTVQDTLYVDAVRIYWQEVTGITSQNEVATAGTNVKGTITGTYVATTSIVPDGTAQQIAETAGALTTLLTQDFSSTTFPPDGWSSSSAQWGRSNTNYAGGTAPEARFTYTASVSQFRLYAGPLDTRGYTSLSLQFRHFLDDYGAGCTMRVQTSTDAAAWTNVWAVNSGGGDVGPTQVTQAISAAQGVGSETFYVSFTVDGDAYQIDYWYVDNVLLTGTPAGYSATYRYTMQNMPVNTISNTLTVHARTSATDEAFNIGYSQNIAGPYTNIISVGSTTYTTYTAPMPTTFDGPMFIQVTDNLLGSGDTAITSIYIDSLYVVSSIAPVNTTVNVVWDLSADDGAGQNDVVSYNVYYSDQATGGTYDGTFSYLGSTPAGSNIFRHYGEAEDLVDNIWYYVRVTDTYSQSAPTGIASKFNLAPDVTLLTVNGDGGVEIAQGTPDVFLFAEVYDDSSTWEGIPKLDGAEFFVGADPGEGSGAAMTESGITGALAQYVYNIDTSMWAVGNYTVYVRGHEAGPGNTGTGWGPTMTVWINVIGSTQAPYDIVMTGHSAGDWVFVSFPIAISGNIQDVLNDALNGDGLTTWDIAKWYNPQDAADPWKTYRVGGMFNDLATLNNAMGVWLHLTANAGDQILTTGMIGDYSTVAVNVNLWAGWNLVGYPSATAQLASATLPVLYADMISVYIASSPYVSDTTDLSSVTMSHGNAYWVHVTADCVWTVNP